jgi:hypothetical protein
MCAHAPLLFLFRDLSFASIDSHEKRQDVFRSRKFILFPVLVLQKNGYQRNLHNDYSRVLGLFQNVRG